MSPDSRSSLPAGRPPWDPWNGVRIGVLTGGALGLALAFVLNLTNFLIALLGAVIGGSIGYWSEKRKQRDVDQDG